MSVSKVLVSVGLVLAFAAGFVVKSAVGPAPVVHAAAADRVFEVRTYVASAGRFDAMMTRFRDHTLRFFTKHGMTSIGYWTPVAGTPGAGNTVMYILAHESREAAAKSWAAFNADPEWQKVRTDSLVGGNPVARADSYFVAPADFSPIK
jgi:NIPSNAP